MTVKTFFSQLDREDIREAVKNAELETSGEIRVHIEDNCSGEVMDRAATVFKKLEMHKTEKRNGVLFYLALQNRKFAVIGDKGINVVVEDNFWDDVKDLLLNHFREGLFTEGLVKGIERVGIKLKNHFPYHSDDLNELSDDVSFGGN